jgi:hypothetical protein
MYVRMLQTRRGSEDGFAVRRFYEGCVYDVADTLARIFINARWAVACEKTSIHIE